MPAYNDTERRNRQTAEGFLKQSSNPNELAWARMILGIFHERERAWDAAVESYRCGVELNPSDSAVLYFCNNNLAFSLIQLGHFEEAEPYCRKAIEIDELRHNAHKNLGLVQQALGQLLEAAGSFAAASILAPSNPRAWTLLEALLQSNPELLSQSKDLRDAVERLKESVNRGNHARMQ